jgi:hypothetical protein
MLYEPVHKATTGKALLVMHGCIGKILPGLTADFCHLWCGGKEMFATFDFNHMGWQHQTLGQQI